MNYIFPVPLGYTEKPIWSGTKFKIGSESTSILYYTKNDTDWEFSLTTLHEDEGDNGNHYIDKSSRLHACNEISCHLPLHGTILEIGSSSSNLLSDINKQFPHTFLIGSYYISTPLETITNKKSNIPLIQFYLVTCPLPDNCENPMVALSVLEDVDDDITVIKQIYRILKPGEYDIIDVSANPELYYLYDEELKPFLTYHMNDLPEKVSVAGLNVITNSYLGM